MPISFDGDVAIVTGAGNGLGKAYALDLARRGGRVVVNDFGGTVNGSEHDEGPADQVVAEIRAATRSRPMHRSRHPRAGKPWSTPHSRRSEPSRSW